jgi:hypothetical protein
MRQIHIYPGLFNDKSKLLHTDSSAIISSPLFQLPQELRDQIYAFALYEEAGLRYRTCRNGFGKLYRHPRIPILSSTIARCLLRYSFRRLSTTRRRSVRENNQLKYVCKRLYAETKGLDFRYNCIIFEDSLEKDALEQCTFLLGCCRTLQEVTIKCSLPSFSSGCSEYRFFSTIERYCRTRANLLVRVHVPYWSQADPSFLLLGLYFLGALRADTHHIAQLAREVVGLDDLNSALELFTAPMKMSNNIRIFPKEERFCQQMFERSCRNNPIVTLPSGDLAQTDVIKVVKGWFEHGL